MLKAPTGSATPEADDGRAERKRCVATGTWWKVNLRNVDLCIKQRGVMGRRAEKEETELHRTCADLGPGSRCPKEG